jgi:hypothetical protein
MSASLGRPTDMADLDHAEIKIIECFARQPREGQALPILNMEQLLVLIDAPRKTVVSGIDRLAQRGWLFRADPKDWCDKDICVLISRGAELAKSEAQRIRTNPVDWRA